MSFLNKSIFSISLLESWTLDDSNASATSYREASAFKNESSAWRSDAAHELHRNSNIIASDRKDIRFIFIFLVTRDKECSDSAKYSSSRTPWWRPLFCCRLSTATTDDCVAGAPLDSDHVHGEPWESRKSHQKTETTHSAA
jgi:hypothetical protein